MNLHVTLETWSRDETIPANLAEERLEEVVESGLVVGEVDFLHEALSTLFALVRSGLFLMSKDHVLLQGIVELKFSWTFLALERVLRRMFFGFVLVKRFSLRERFVANMA